MKYLLTFLLLVPVWAMAQEIPTGADKSTLEKTIKVYKQVLAKENNQTVQLELAEAYYLLGSYKESAEQYRTVIQKEGTLPIHYKIYSEVLAKLGNTDSAKFYENKYQKSEIEAILLAKDLQLLTGFSHDTISFFVNKVPFNSSDADFSPILVDSSIIFVSTRKKPEDLNIHENTGEPLYDLYKVVERPKDEYSKAEKMRIENIDHDVAEGPICFSPDLRYIYFNRNFLDAHGKTGKSAKLVDKLHIMYGKFENNKITDIKPFEHNEYDYSSTQPYITRDGSEMFFVANHPEGNGGFDIYVSKRTYDGKWGKPENLGRTINTDQDELYPFLDAQENLYFASAGHLGLGGLDIFVSKRTEDGWSEPYNLGTPFNSHYDDFGVYFKKDMKSGYFSSNRPGGLGSDDIYTFVNIFDNPKERKEIMEVFLGKLNKDLFLTKKGVQIRGNVRDKRDNRPIEDTWVLLIDQYKSEVRQAVTDDDGNFVFKYVTPGNYIMVYEEKQEFAKSSFQLVPGDTIYNFSPDYVAQKQIAKIDIDPKKVNPKNLLLGTISAPGVDNFVGKDVFLVDLMGKIRNHAVVNGDGYYAFKNLKYEDYLVILKEPVEGATSATYLCNVDNKLKIKKEEIISKEEYYDNSYPANASAVNTLIVGNIDSEISKKVLGSIPVFWATTNLKHVRTTATNQPGYFIFENLKPRNTIVFNEANHRALIADRHVTLDMNIENHLVTEAKIKKFRSLRRKIDKNERLVINGKVIDLKNNGNVAQKSVLLMDKSNNVIAKAISNEEGYYMFPHLAYDNSYKIIFETYEPDLTVKNSLSFIDMDLQEFYGKKGAYKYADLKGIADQAQEININCKAFYNSNRQPAENVAFFLANEEGKIIKRLTTNKDGAFYFYKQQVGNYMIVQETLDTSITVTINSKRKSYSKLRSNIEIAGSKEYQLFNSVYFDFAQSDLNESAKNVLTNFHKYMKTNKVKKVVLNGYGDMTGSADKTLVITSKRAKNCKDFLDFRGIDLKKIETHAKGMTDEFKNENNEYDPALNRKVDILFLE